MTADDIIAGFEAGRPGTERYARLRERVARIGRDRDWGDALSALCGLDGRALGVFLRAVRPDPAPAGTPRGLECLVSLVEDLMAGTERVRLAPAREDYETTLLRHVHEALARRKLGLAKGEGDAEAEALARRTFEARPRPVVLVPDPTGAGEGPRAMLAALAGNAALAEAAGLRSADLAARRRAALDRRAA
jgi:hypothetical protein